MSAMSTTNGPGSRPSPGRDRARACWLLLAVAVAAPAVAVAAEERPAGGTAPLEQLAGVIGSLRASLSAIRQDMAAMQMAAVADDVAPAPAAACTAAPPGPAGDRSALARELEEVRASAAAERAAWQQAEAAMTGELIGLRGRVAAADAAVAELHRDRDTLVRRIGELDQALAVARTSEVVDDLLEVQPPSSAPVAPLQAGPMIGLMRVAQPALAAEMPAALRTTERPPGSPLDLRAELALAQLRITELTSALNSSRQREQTLEAEAAKLRLLTDAQIRRFMGRD